MTKKKWKGPFIDKNIIKNLNKKKLHPKISRNSIIIPKFLGLKFNIHSGKNFLEIQVSKEMVGHKFGEFSPTRKKFSFKKKKKKSN